MQNPQCPRCPLKFTNRSEMQWHLREDHPPDRPVRTVAPLTIPVANPDPPPQDPPRGWRRWWRRRAER